MLATLFVVCIAAHEVATSRGRPRSGEEIVVDLLILGGLICALAASAHDFVTLVLAH
jgi:hypothetical protein